MNVWKRHFFIESLFKDGVLLFVATFYLNYFIAESFISLFQIILAISWIITIIFFCRNTIVAKLNYIEGEWKSYVKSFFVGFVITIVSLFIFIRLKHNLEYSYINMSAAGLLIYILITHSVKRYFIGLIIGFMLGKIHLVKNYN